MHVSFMISRAYGALHCNYNVFLFSVPNDRSEGDERGAINSRLDRTRSMVQFHSGSQDPEDFSLRSELLGSR
jgi:hypothetical protein